MQIRKLKFTYCLFVILILTCTQAVRADNVVRFARNINEIRSFSDSDRQDLSTYFQAQDVGGGVHIFCVFHKSGSGIQTIDASLYICEPKGCFLSLFFVARTMDMKFFFDKNNGDISLLSEDGSVLAIGKFPSLHSFANIKNR